MDTHLFVSALATEDELRHLWKAERLAASPSSSPSIAAAPASAEPTGGVRSPSSSPPGPFASPASAEPPGGARSPSSSPSVAPAPTSAEPPGCARVAVIAPQASAGPAALVVASVACLDPHPDFEIGRWLVTAWAGPALVSRAVR